MFAYQCHCQYPSPTACQCHLPAGKHKGVLTTSSFCTVFESIAFILGSPYRPTFFWRLFHLICCSLRSAGQEMLKHHLLCFLPITDGTVLLQLATAHHDAAAPVSRSAITGPIPMWSRPLPLSTTALLLRRFIPIANTGPLNSTIISNILYYYYSLSCCGLTRWEPEKKQPLW